MLGIKTDDIPFLVQRIIHTDIATGNPLTIDAGVVYATDAESARRKAIEGRHHGDLPIPPGQSFRVLSLENHDEPIPTHFAETPVSAFAGSFRPTDTESKIASNDTFNRMWSEAGQLTPNDAVRLAQRLLVAVDAHGIQQRPDFQSPQAVQRYVRKAITALRGLSLS